MNSQVPEALGRKLDRLTSGDSDLPVRKLSVQEAAKFLPWAAERKCQSTSAKEGF
jgi:hypothetical protein